MQSVVRAVMGRVLPWRASEGHGGSVRVGGGCLRAGGALRRETCCSRVRVPGGVSVVEQVVLVMGVFLVQVTCGQRSDFGGSNKYVQGSDVGLTQEDIRNLQDDHLTPYNRVAKAVSVDDFSKVLKTATSYHDVLRAFYGSVLTNEAIDTIMTSHPQRKYYSSAFGRPRIGGLSDSMSFSMGAAHLQGMSSVMHDDATLLRSAYSIPRGRRRHRHGSLDARIGRRQRRRDRRKEKNKKRKDHDAALEHYKEMETKAQCRLPVPVVLRIRDISNAASKVYFPECTIVHRCRADAGCCNETSTCSSSANTTIQRSFFALEYVKDGDRVLPGKQIVETLTFVNHTECACMPKQQIPECRECPIPFSLRRENKTDCTCDCFYRHHTCIHIKKGKTPLHEQQLRLIKEGSRLPPKCQYGVFGQESIRTGYCPSKKPKKHRPKVVSTGEEMVSGYGAADSARRRGNWG